MELKERTKAMLSRLIVASRPACRTTLRSTTYQLNSASKVLAASSRTMATSKSGEVRVERDTFGELDVPADKYYGAQTAR